jgi:hypothetical protein
MLSNLESEYRYRLKDVGLPTRQKGKCLGGKGVWNIRNWKLDTLLKRSR